MQTFLSHSRKFISLEVFLLNQLANVTFFFRSPFSYRLFEYFDQLAPRRAVFRLQICDYERADMFRDADLEYVLPERGDKDGIIWIVVMYFPVLETVGKIQQDKMRVKLSKSFATRDG